MKSIYKAASVLLVASILTCCTNYEDVNSNPNEPTKVTAELLASKLIGQMIKSGGNHGKDESKSTVLAKQIIWAEGSGMSEQWNGSFLGKSFDSYGFIIGARDMVAADPDNAAYRGLASFVKAYKLYYLTLDLGDIPYSEIGGAETGSLTPKYDTQKEVFKQILHDLDVAYGEFAKGTGKMDGDFVFKGDLELWKKTVTAFQLKVLINLSKKVNDGDLNVKQKFNEVMQRGLMTSNKDNFQLTYLEKEHFRALYYNGNFVIYPMLSEYLVEKLKALDDYRLFYYANPSKKRLEEGKTADQYDAYVGVDHMGDVPVVQAAYSSGAHCLLNYRYTHYPLSEPMIRLGYGEQQLILAEACLRGWISGNASDYYNAGIRANMTFSRDATPANISIKTDKESIDYDATHGRKMTDDYIEKYVGNEKVKLTGAFEQDLEKIITQKYIMSFNLQYMYEVFYDYRRTGYPVIPVDPRTNQNPNINFKDKMPLRYTYPGSELSYNKDNVTEAIIRQFGDVGNDEVNQSIWIIKD